MKSKMTNDRDSKATSNERSFWISSLGFVSNFVIRISDFHSNAW